MDTEQQTIVCNLEPTGIISQPRINDQVLLGRLHPDQLDVVVLGQCHFWFPHTMLITISPHFTAETRGKGPEVGVYHWKPEVGQPLRNIWRDPDRVSQYTGKHLSMFTIPTALRCLDDIADHRSLLESFNMEKRVEGLIQVQFLVRNKSIGTFLVTATLDSDPAILIPLRYECQAKSLNPEVRHWNMHASLVSDRECGHNQDHMNPKVRFTPEAFLILMEY